MNHLVTRCPAHVHVEVRPAKFCGFIAVATNEQTQRTSEPVWGASDIEARQRAEFLVELQ